MNFYIREIYGIWFLRLIKALWDFLELCFEIFIDFVLAPRWAVLKLFQVYGQFSTF